MELESRFRSRGRTELFVVACYDADLAAEGRLVRCGNSTLKRHTGIGLR
jgi:hypothetical protein